MPFIQNQGAKIFWDEQGQGAPILLIMGLGWPSYLWHRTRPVLAPRFHTIAFDNRGVGQSDIPPGPYTIPLMASDAAAVLDAAGVERAHVFGLSMGGMIAQEFALQYPSRVECLILGCTAPGGAQAVRAEPLVTQHLFARDLSAEEFSRGMNPFIYDPGTPQERIEADFVLRKQWFARPEAYMAQLQAILTWEAYSRLPQITAPTIVIHGEHDRLVPPANGKIIADRIPGAKLVMIPNASHILSTDQPDAVHHAVLDFLNTHSGRHREMQP